ncbi:MAG: DNA ligase [Paenibacillus sp.]|nr:DNA ligase [Paenibacillus sp.]
MNIGSMIRGLLGDSKVGEPKSLELKEGQIVRGVVLNVSESGKEAIVQIQGTPVRAELETPLQVGQTMNLQVSPPGEGGLPVLKPVSMGEAALVSPQSMGEALESLGLTDAKAGREIVLAMQSGGVALTKETAAQLNAAMNVKPVGVPTEQWLEAAVISVKRGLPVTADSIKGLQQAVFGPQLHQLIANLEEQLSIWAGQKEGNGTGVSLTSSPSSSPLPSAGALISNSAAAETLQKGVTPGSAGIQTSTVDAEVPEPNDGKVPLNVNKAVASSALVAGNNDSNEAITNEVTDAGRSATTVVRSGENGVVAPSASGISQGQNGLSAGGPLVNGAGNALTGQAQIADGIVSSDNSIVHAGSNTDISKSAGDIAASANALKNAAGDMTTPLAAGKNAADGVSTLAPDKDAADGVATLAAGKNTASGEVSAPAVGADRSGAALLAKLQGVLTELRGTLPQLAAVPPASAAGPDPAPAAGTPRGGDNPAAAAPPLQGAPAPTPDTESWVGRVLKLLGAEHEQQAVRGGAGIAAEARPAAGATAADGRGAPLTPAALHASVGDEVTADTLKGVLLQVLGSSEVPAALKEAAGQLVQHMTGQQLLLNTDRTAPFAQVTLFLPIKGPNGEETASVHIQSRRGRKGELDAANCHLWFDLNMKQLGQTLVDVHVVDHIVSLKLHNNEPWVLELLENRRDEIKTAVEAIGYQLSGLKTEPLPIPKGTESDKSFGKLSNFVPDAYKGVDYRI